MIKIFKSKIFSFFAEGHERTINAKKNIAISFIIKGLSFIVGLILVPITIEYVNPTQYGVWLTLSSIIGWLSFFDIGLGNGLKNKLAEGNALGKEANSKIYVSTTYAILAIISIIIFAVFFIINHFINWNKILNFPAYEGINFNELTLLLVALFCFQFCVQLINIVLAAYHVPAKASFIMLIGQMISLVAIYILIHNTKGSVLYLILALAGIPVVVQFLANIWFYKFDYNEIKPSIKTVDFKYAKNLLSTGGVFFIIQIGSLLLYQTDNIVITNLLGPKEVTIFNIAYKYFSIIIMCYTIMMTPFWSAFTEAYAKGELGWIQSVVKKMLNYWLLMVLGAIILLLLSSTLIKLWLRGTVHVPNSVLVMMSIYAVGYCWLLLHCSLLNGIGKIKVQLYLYIVSTIINIPLAIVLGKYLGLVGITLSNVIVFIYMGIILRVQCKKILNNTATGIWNN